MPSLSPEGDLRAVVAALCDEGPLRRAPPGWCVTPVCGGSNSRLYRARRDREDYAIKIPPVDGRDRAGREAAILGALEAAAVPDVPRLVLYEPRDLGAPVVVQTWLAGEPLSGPPASDSEWDLLLAHVCRVHAVSRSAMGARGNAVPAGADNAGPPDVSLGRIRDLLAEAPCVEKLAGVAQLIARLAESRLPAWDAPEPVLCRVDHFVCNYVRVPGGMGSVDWEYSGWGDPANDLAELVTHPAYLDVPADRWAWLAERYAGMTGGTDVIARFVLRRLLNLLGWAARCGRAAVGVPVPSDRKRMGQPGFRATSRERYGRYLRRAERLAMELA